MKFCIVQSPAMNCLFIRSAGKFDPEHVRTMIRSGSQLDFYRQRVKIFHDLRLVSFEDDLQPVKALASTLPTAPLHMQMGMVSGTDLGFRMLEAYTRLREKAAHLHRAFRCPVRALAWLDLQSDSGDVPATVAEIFNGAVSTTDRAQEQFQMIVRRTA